MDEQPERPEASHIAGRQMQHGATPLERATRALRTLSAGNRILLRATDEAQLLEDMCAVIVGTGGYRRAGVVYAEQDQRQSIQWMVWVRDQDGRPQSEDINWLNEFGFTYADDASGKTAVGTAIRTRLPCVGRDVLNGPIYADPNMAVFRAHAIQDGYAAITAFPLITDGEPLGALFMAATEPDAFDDEEVRLLAELADDLAFGIASLRLRERHRAAQATIERLAFYEPETGLPNRVRQQQLLSEALKRASSNAVPLSLVHFKICRFNEISHVFGYRIAGELVREVVRRLLDWTTPDRSLARVGEACFSMILYGSGSADAIAFARALCHALDEPIDLVGVVLDAPIHAGVACEPVGRTDADTLLKHANAALYHGVPVNDRVTVAADARLEDHAGRLALMGDLRRAAEHNELRLYCQPKVEIRSRRVVGAEVLVRWAHPVLGMIPPVRFIKLAEQSGIITRVTGWLLDSVFSALRNLKMQGTAQTLAINLSAYDFRNPSIARQVENLLSVWGVNPALVQFELTESALIDDPGATLVVLSRLKSMGVELLIDDFGTGYSGLSYLQKFPVDGIKIDQSFVMPMIDSSDSAAIVRSTIDLGHSLDLHVVAEGVESEAIWQRLADERCDVAQGYLIGMPMPVEQFPQWQIDWAARGAIPAAYRAT
ncbi:putative bifunctional diguanylate cyclase/phosphodiesterase [Noviherbaspirillum sp.]|uniref:putative bifunctional diguanylate cyclase/phosphodiesterase n=1 Tax=Noviherbaspirillum sp. TaxID=1926288 RepID=UPI002D230FD7|nr:EAL domain-containing protein [Noviherbaspirillum sp.]HZW20847.1 EAL domain-containing protein [Noviherbaspirillum sp.]